MVRSKCKTSYGLIALLVSAFWTKRCILLIAYVVHSTGLGVFDDWITSMPSLLRSWLIISILQWLSRRCQVHAVAFCWLRNCTEFANEGSIDWNCTGLYSITANPCLSRMSQTFSPMVLTWRISLCIFHTNLFLLSLLTEISVNFEVGMYAVLRKNISLTCSCNVPLIIMVSYSVTCISSSGVSIQLSSFFSETETISPRKRDLSNVKRWLHSES